MSARAAAESLIHRMRAEMPLLDFMGLQVEAADETRLSCQVPLAPNRNDKHTAFAGSLASVSTVTGWALLMLWAERTVGPCLVAVVTSELKYRRPVVSDLLAVATLPSEESLADLAAQIERRGRGRVTLQLSVGAADANDDFKNDEAVIQTASYVVWRAD